VIRASSANIVFLGLAVALLSGAAYPGGVNFDAPAHDEFGCNQNSWVCAWDYLSLPQRFPQHASPQRWTSAELTDWVQQARDQLVQFEEPQPAEHELAGRIRETLDADWLWRRNGLFGGTPAEVRVGPLIPPHRHRDHERTHVWIEDDVALGFPAIVMLPPGPGPHPAVLMAHGHSGDAHQSIVDLGGLELAEAGYVVLAPTFRINGGSVVEDAVTRDLLEGGFSLLALRVYEQLMALRVLRAMPEVDPGRVGLLAHSGGNAGAMLLMRLAPWVGALVTDNSCQYYSEGTAQTEPVPEVLDETFPPLFPIHPALLRLDELVSPALRIPYGPKDSMDEILEFFEATL